MSAKHKDHGIDTNTISDAVDRIFDVTLYYVFRSAVSCSIDMKRFRVKSTRSLIIMNGLDWVDYPRQSHYRIIYWPADEIRLEISLVNIRAPIETQCKCCHGCM